MLNIAVNYLAVIAAAVAGAVVNALWYSVILKAQVNALRAADATIAGRNPAPPMYAVALIGQLLSAFVLAVLLRSLGMTNIAGGLIAAALVWLGCTITAVAQVHTFGYRKPGFIAVDGTNWLLAMLGQGAVIGAFG